MRSLVVYIEQRRVGTLFETDDLWAFEYDSAWASASDSFDLSPALPRAQLRHDDGGTNRPVQWYFDNLLPEELLRSAIEREAGIKGDDAFALLEYLGAESAGSLTLLPPSQELPKVGRLHPLSAPQLSERIDNLPRNTLVSNAPKRMSLAGAQHKLLVVVKGDQLFEPEGATPSTHVLKPNHPDANTYPASVFNEYVTMRLASALDLQVPPVSLMYVPQPVYIVERFDRIVSNEDGGDVRRLHVIDACQLLNKARSFKHTGATLETLARIIDATTNKISTRLRLFSWLVFNVLTGNDDCHLKNLSFHVSADAIALAPHYDLLSTGAYYTRAIASEKATWPNVKMAFALPGATHFEQVTPATILEAAAVLGVPERIARRILSAMVRKFLPAFHTLTAEAEAEAAEPALPENARRFVGAQAHLARVLDKITYHDMLQRLRE
ncbi:MAG TPA: HipA domain-containing protein [Burkholderiales bacterium]|nr:HipA domain-containing protein [Burkholderiales bacterium]